jgi:hypothetical protein
MERQMDPLEAAADEDDAAGARLAHVRQDRPDHAQDAHNVDVERTGAVASSAGEEAATGCLVVETGLDLDQRAWIGPRAGTTSSR